MLVQLYTCLKGRAFPFSILFFSSDLNKWLKGVVSEWDAIAQQGEGAEATADDDKEADIKQTGDGDAVAVTGAFCNSCIGGCGC